MTQTLLDKIWKSHRVTPLSDGNDLIFIDRHLVHEVTSPQAFEGLRLAKRPVRRTDLTIATMDHNIPTLDKFTITDSIAKAQVETLSKNCKEFGVTLYDLNSDRQGIVHVIGPELGLTLPGTTVVCGDSHTSTHGAFGALAFGIGTSEVEHVLATQCLQLKKPKSFLVNFSGKLNHHVYSKDMILYLIGLIGTAGGTGYAFEYAGEAIQSLSMEARMSLCNMSIEAGARAGLIAPDETTIDYLTKVERPFSPKGDDTQKAITYWQTLPSDEGASFDKEISIDCSKIAPQVSWGTNPGMVIGIDEVIPNPSDVKGCSPADVEKALSYMDLKPGQKLTDQNIDVVFIGSCTNSRIEDLRIAAEMMKDKKVSSRVQALIVPGSQKVRQQAEAEGLDKVFTQAGAEWRDAGCSMCLAMNPDKLKPGQRCASTSNRNFEGRQGKAGRTHLLSPAMAAAAAIEGKFVDIRNWS